MSEYGEVVGIFIAPEAGGAVAPQDRVELEAGRGIVGDRYFGDVDGQVTLVDADRIDEVNTVTGWSLVPADTRRNIVTRGIDLNQWETGRFRVGDAELEGIELCEPCASLGASLENSERSSRDVVKALVHKAGLRARIITGTHIAVGDSVRPL